MHSFSIANEQSTDNFYKDLGSAAASLVANETDAIANMANISALIWQFVPNLNWAGFYRVIDQELVLGPFQGKSACIRIAMGKGVCGTAAKENVVQRVADVHTFPGHIACDADSRSELVIPVCVDKKVIAVFDLDSPIPDRFSEADQAGLTILIQNCASAFMPQAN